VDDITLSPTYVGPGTLVKALFDVGWYSSPRLTSIVEVLAEVGTFAEKVRVALSCVDRAGSDGSAPQGCADCDARIESALLAYSSGSKTVQLRSLGCSRCAADAAAREVWDRQSPIPSRITRSLSVIGA